MPLRLVLEYFPPEIRPEFFEGLYAEDGVETKRSLPETVDGCA
jgi:hypothetical protein